jgi:hypothetical protein
MRIPTLYSYFQKLPVEPNFTEIKSIKESYLLQSLDDLIGN